MKEILTEFCCRLFRTGIWIFAFSRPGGITKHITDYREFQYDRFEFYCFFLSGSGYEVLDYICETPVATNVSDQLELISCPDDGEHWILNHSGTHCFRSSEETLNYTEMKRACGRSRLFHGYTSKFSRHSFAVE